MPDSSVYSKFNINSYLRNYAVIGEHPVLGEGWDYLRLRLQYFMAINPEYINSALYYTKAFWYSADANQLIAYKTSDQWSSTGMIWSEKISAGDEVAYAESDKNDYYSLQLTDFVKECFGGSLLEESFGLILKSELSNEYIIASSDNTMYAPYLVINMNQLPDNFIVKDNINQVN